MNDDDEAEVLLDRLAAERMAAQMKQRRRASPNQRQVSQPRAFERRTMCAYCFERGDHATDAQCLTALEEKCRIGAANAGVELPTDERPITRGSQAPQK